MKFCPRMIGPAALHSIGLESLTSDRTDDVDMTFKSRAIQAFAAAAFILLSIGLAPARAGATEPTPPVCYGYPNLAVNDYYNPYSDLQLHGLQRCAGFGSTGYGTFQFWRLELTADRVTQSFPPGGVFFLWAAESGTYGDGYFLWFPGRTSYAVSDPLQVQFNIHGPLPYGGAPENWHRRLDVRYGAYDQPTQARVVAHLIAPPHAPA